MENKKIDSIELLIIYKNYLHSIMYRREFKDKYGDTIELIKLYEKKLKLVNKTLIED